MAKMAILKLDVHVRKKASSFFETNDCAFKISINTKLALSITVYLHLKNQKTFNVVSCLQMS